MGRHTQPEFRRRLLDARTDVFGRLRDDAEQRAWVDFITLLAPTESDRSTA